MAPINFGAGPSMLPPSVLQKAHEGFFNFSNTGLSVMEVSHRSKEFQALMDHTEAQLRSLISVPDNYKVLFLQGGGSGQFSSTVLNLLASRVVHDRYAAYHAANPGDDKSAQPTMDFLVTGSWSRAAANEARRLGVNVNVVFDTKEQRGAYSGIPNSVDQWRFSPPGKAMCVYYCDNETVHGVEFPPIDDENDILAQALKAANDADVPIVCDMSSNFISRKIDVSKYAIIYAGAQKNIGPSGATVVIVRDDILERVAQPCDKEPALQQPAFPIAQTIPLMMDYKRRLASHTPPNNARADSSFDTASKRETKSARYTALAHTSFPPSAPLNCSTASAPLCCFCSLLFALCAASSLYTVSFFVRADTLIRETIQSVCLFCSRVNSASQPSHQPAAAVALAAASRSVPVHHPHANIAVITTAITTANIAVITANCLGAFPTHFPH
ncbi:PLP-dependent transferase [Ramicandelaber brevisporus]|nr:PLP-dependent transferase [Ramicandelaber brevisporus]